MKRKLRCVFILGGLFSIVLAMNLACGYAVEQESIAKDDVKTVRNIKLPTESVLPKGIPGENSRLMGYLAGEEQSKSKKTRESKLTNNEKIVYKILKKRIEELAAGRTTSSITDITLKDLGLDKEFTAKDLGLKSLKTQDDFNAIPEAMKKLINVDTRKLINAILNDFPYALYWYDKTKDTYVRPPQGLMVYQDNRTGRVFVKFDKDSYTKKEPTLQVRMKVSDNYGNGYSIDKQKATKASETRKVVDSIIEKYSSLDDLKKLEAYKDEIIRRTDYNYAAAEASEDRMPYGDPWQLIHVFDNDIRTDVVCEGYSKAFKFLCDLSVFKDKTLNCNCVGGKLFGTSGDGPHMWNLVSAKGKNYLVDVTNMDGGKKANHSKLFMVGTNMNPGRRYYVNGDDMPIGYEYSDDTRRIFDDSELQLSQNNYVIDLEKQKEEDGRREEKPGNGDKKQVPVPKNNKKKTVKYKISGIKKFKVKVNKKYRNKAFLSWSVNKLVRKDFKNLSKPVFKKLTYKYQIAYKKKGSKKWSYKTISAKKYNVKYTLKKLKKGNKYNVRVRTFVTVSKTNHYGSWSKINAFKVK